MCDNRAMSDERCLGSGTRKGLYQVQGSRTAVCPICRRSYGTGHGARLGMLAEHTVRVGWSPDPRSELLL